jgi:hypothetical protein
MYVDPCREVTPLMEATLEAYATMDAAGEEWKTEVRAEVDRDRERLMATEIAVLGTPEKLTAFRQILEDGAIQAEELYKEARRDTEQAARTHRMG